MPQPPVLPSSPLPRHGQHTTATETATPTPLQVTAATAQQDTPSTASSIPQPASPPTYQDHIGVPKHSARHSSRILSQSTRIYIHPDKLDADGGAGPLAQLVVHLGGQLTTSAEAANIVVTALSAPKRIAKFISDEQLRHRFLVRPGWLHDVRRRGVLVDPDEWAVGASKAGGKRKRPCESESVEPVGSAAEAEAAAGSSSSLPPPPTDPGSLPPAPQWTNTRYACKRPSPLVCVNQAVVDELETIRAERRLTGDTFSEMAYMRAISALKGYPLALGSDPGRAETIKGVGKKVSLLVRQFYAEGRIVEAKVIRRDRAVQIMRSFTELYGIGPVGAREAYNEGCRTFADVLAKGRGLAASLRVAESLRILPDLRTPIGRAECREITAHLVALLRAVLPDCVHTICGSYRRGKPYTYDLDIVVGHPAASRAVLQRLLEAMRGQGLVTHVVSVTTPQDDESVGLHVDVAHLVVLLPATPTRPVGVHRRVDLVFAPMTVYGAAVLGYSGSTVFERDIRVWCKTKGYKFSFTGVTRLEDGAVVPTPTEREIFDLFGLEYMPPEWRNCDA